METIRCAGGMTLIELLVTLAILSILAAMALPYAEITVRRSKEIELRQALREVRSAIDRFHEEWRAGRISRASPDVSENGFPKRLTVLVEGVERSGASGGKERYLRRIPRNPMAPPLTNPEDHWRVEGYRDERESPMWGGEDVYDLYSGYDGTALDESRYVDW